MDVPGIGGCLSVGSNAAKTLAAALGKPLVGVHHMVRFLTHSFLFFSLHTLLSKRTHSRPFSRLLLKSDLGFRS